MSKGAFKSNQADDRKADTLVRQANDNQAHTQEVSALDDPLASKPERSDLSKLIPFLQERVAFKMPSDLKYLDGVLDYINERMLKLGLIDPGDSEVIIALDEAIVNAVKHGNKCNPRKSVHIVADFSPHGARFTVKDAGCGFSRDQVPDPTDPARLLEPSGRGLLLINHIMDEVSHNHCGNEIQMFKRAPHAPEQGLRAERPRSRRKK
jgi:serine/threonine-protein kinase RsbW